MSKYASGGIMKRGIAYVAKASGAETASTTGNGIEVGEAGSIYVPVNVTAVTGTTPTLVVVIEGSADGTTWFTVGQIGLSGFVVGSGAAAPTNITANGLYPGVFPTMQFMRYRSVIGGTTPSFTYSVGFEADKSAF